MSCGNLHDPGFAEHLDAPPHDHPAPAAPAGADPAGAPAEKQPSRARAIGAAAWAHHGWKVKPFMWAAGVDGATTAAHPLLLHLQEPFHGYGSLDAALASIAAGLVAETVTEIRNKHYKRSETYRNDIRRAAAAATAWSALASGSSPVGWHGIVQWLGLAAGTWFAGSYVHELVKARRAPKPAALPPGEEPKAIEAPPEVDPRLQLFIDSFCAPGKPLAGVTCGGFMELPLGFLFQVHFPDTDHDRLNQQAVRNLTGRIAMKYSHAMGFNVTAADVKAGYVPDARSEKVCQVIVTTAAVVSVAERNDPTWNRWDGKSSWDPATGTIDLGRFEDDTVTHFGMNEPYSGAEAGMIAGARGSGKTGTLHVLTGEAGMAKLCAVCGTLGGCPGACDLQRVMATWVGDAQGQAMGVWSGRADLTGWGPEGCAELLDLATTAADARKKFNRTMEWSDRDPVTGQPRQHTGKGWFDPAVGYPLIFLLIDELPALVAHPDKQMVKTAVARIVHGIFEWRKVGIHLEVATQSLDQAFIGDREVRDQLKLINSIAHRLDETSSYMGAITGDPRLLPYDMKGAGYINSRDRRPGDIFFTKHLPEVVRPGQSGVDVAHVASVIASTPILYDLGTREAMDLFRVRHQQVLEDWHGADTGEDDDAPALAAVPDEAEAAVLGVGGVALSDDVDKVLTFVKANPDASLRQIMSGTGLALGPAGRAVDALTQNGHIYCPSENQYTAA